MVSVFKFIDHPADIAVEISGSNYEELFLAGLNSLKNSLLEPAKVKRKNMEEIINLEEDTIEELIVSFLGEINYDFESRKIFPLEVRELHIQKRRQTIQLISTINFGNITTEDKIKSEIKAITFHQLDVKKVDNVYTTIIVFDI